MTLAQRLKQIRAQAGLSQEAFGAQGFVSGPGWIKIENGQRQPGEELIAKLLDWLVGQRHIPAKNRAPLRDELLTLKYLAATRPFLRELARNHALNTPPGKRLVAAFDAARNVRTVAQRGRPRGPIRKP